MIEAIGLTKTFKLYRSPSDRLLESLLRKPRHRRYIALDEVSFAVEPGETLGILGRNGAGKSTLLKLLMGVLLPDRGELRLSGKLTGLLELGTGFDTSLTGLQNIERNGRLLGMSGQEIADRRAEIIAFSELGDYIGEPLRTYSSGMTMRLAFAIAIHADPACFLVDEALSVGDAHFQQKCIRRIKQFRDQGGSLIFVSHDLNAVKVLCDRAIVLERGRVVAAGTPDAAVNAYNRIIADLDEDAPLQASVDEAVGGYGNRALELIGGELCGEVSGADLVSAGEPVSVCLRIKAQQRIEDFTLGILIRDRFGQDVFGTNSYFLGQPLTASAGERLTVELCFPMNLAPGKYTLTAALHSAHNHLQDCYHWCDNLLRFEVAGIIGPVFYGIARLEPRMRVYPGGHGPQPPSEDETRAISA
ncbi:ABC transporter ATP-binding protein [Halochromatium roseum]|uniref:ABC transporter ATP-binding protein n=1 Tax=Halochromatium roseum TaxID=391920 RepID=UPI0019126C8D|nr:ABC transporter ATP-binding protein [Halochromatium roseum]MBK5938435.1 ABC transporter ATP-binding protein [Halochromatium roseum]